MSMKALEWAMYDVPAEMVKGALLRSCSCLPTTLTRRARERSRARSALWP